ncbi:acyl-CoA dehydrogenase [Chitinivorax tropicus]|uniref:3-methylmercaptopropionyl-CoA dehydrogenase n=1 Tax=Chitinivorax tropicus TaxID=714531 RepID=A0A840MKX9_9PROT|nr:acyl-CoA dehydrogenase C-terminal domain-containing protein [Chitinivorax tropicus]MBB5019308.1 acyl-CoA dehydrogenase [Chitinivorax tropicus]
MATYKAPLRDMQFVLHELLDAEKVLSTLSGYEEVSKDVLDQYLEASAQFCENEIAPLNRAADEEGCHWDNGVVTTPKGFKEAYKQFCELGFPSLDCDPAYGGQGMPKTLGFPSMEMLVSANVAWSMYPGLSHGAYSAIHAHGEQWMKDLYLPKIVDGTWSGTMCLTEPHCGTDLGLLKSKAEANGDGTFNITGTKIFISAGEHDLTDNIVHLVLARLPDSPKDIKGISLFLVPKFIPDASGKPGVRNGVSCGSIEHKMGIKANATAVLNFDGAKGWLVGEVNKGMACMFTMMNAARLGCGMQGLGLGESAYQNAVAYAKDRVQMRSLSGTKRADLPADPIIVHPDVRRMLLTGKAYTEAGRAFSTWLAMQLDIEERSTDEAIRQDAADLVALLTPIAKAFMTDNGFVVTNQAMQVYGGHGFIREWGMEQYVRDCRISQIYEGTNTIQALDLIGRKVLLDQGQKLRKFTKIVHKFCEAQAQDAQMKEFVEPLQKLMKDVGDVTMHIGMQAMMNKDEAGAAAVDYLRLVGHLVFGYFWAWMVSVALGKMESGDKKFYQAKVHTARFYFQRLMPETAALLQTLRSGSKNLMDLEEDSFIF